MEEYPDSHIYQGIVLWVDWLSLYLHIFLEFAIFLFVIRFGFNVNDYWDPILICCYFCRSLGIPCLYNCKKKFLVLIHITCYIAFHFHCLSSCCCHFLPGLMQSTLLQSHSISVHLLYSSQSACSWKICF
jgi:hypothetical protein